ncbi:MAG: DbpA RNA binding domain-containing protein, partial [Rudaea sp.]
EKRLLQAIERATRQPITEMQLPSVDAVNDRRTTKFKQRIADALAGDDLAPFRQLVEQYERERNVPAVEIAAALARLVQGKQPLLLQPAPRESRPFEKPRAEKPSQHERLPTRAPARSHESTPLSARRDERPRKAEAGFETYRIAVGNDHGVRPGNIVGAIANEAGLDSKHIGRIEIRDRYTLLDLPTGMPEATFQLLKTVRVSGQRLLIARAGESPDSAPASGKPPRKPPFKPTAHKSKPVKPGGFDKDGFDKRRHGPHKRAKAR